LSALAADRVAAAVFAAGLRPISGEAASRLAEYGNLLHRWNRRTNLTAIGDEEGILGRHLVECVAASQAIPEGATLLDFGSGAGLPGIPVAICRPELRVTLAESQGKKAAFLREAARVVGGGRIEVFAGRVAQMGERRFDLVTMRAVDRMEGAIAEAVGRVTSGGWLVLFAATGTVSRFRERVGECLGPVECRPFGLPTVGSLLMFHVERK
jgi:16S rRNA (guanine527-N7)-methyltransferase